MTLWGVITVIFLTPGSVVFSLFLLRGACAIVGATKDIAEEVEKQ